MSQHKNFFSRAMAAVIESRERQARRYVARFEREYGRLNDELTKR